jgi:hypothetical protein
MTGYLVADRFEVRSMPEERGRRRCVLPVLGRDVVLGRAMSA